jgi:hypothetical protein
VEPIHGLRIVERLFVTPGASVSLIVIGPGEDPCVRVAAQGLTTERRSENRPTAVRAGG